jgi:hypothetical protein
VGTVTDPKDAPGDPFGGFVVETEVKPDGRLIHYYAWPVTEPAEVATPAADTDDDV